jgi:hypothetical protein
MATTQAMAPIPELTLGPGMQIKFEALDPATSLAVAGVTVSRVSIVGQKSGAHVAEVALRNLMRSTPPRRPSSPSSSSGGPPARAGTSSGAARPPR